MYQKNDTNMVYDLYQPGCLVWVPCQREVWKPGIVSKVNKSQVYVNVSNTLDDETLENVSEEIIIDCSGDQNSNNSKIYIRVADELSDYGVVAPDDLCELTHLNQPAILHALNTRFDLDKIYTFTGPILIAINPFRKLNKLYDSETLENFRSVDSFRIPHVFSIANKAYFGIYTEQKSQTVLISGESGAGKTETTKFVLQFLAIAGASGGSFEDQILQSNPLLEAFGNSQTLRNNNSSRFGKFIEICFGNNENNNRLQICSASINTYLLEKVRVCFQQEGERNFHIFYQLCAAASTLKDSKKHTYIFPSSRTNSISFLNTNSYSSDRNDGFPKENIKIPNMEIDLSYIREPEYYRYLRMSKFIDCDIEQFERTLYATSAMGITTSDFHNILKVLKAILYLGNIEFNEDGEGSIITEECLYDMKIASFLLSVPEDQLKLVLCFKKLQLKEGEVMKPLNISEAEMTRDSLAKTFYGLVFEYIVLLVNSKIKSFNISQDNLPYCGVLDIFGFECFLYNSFEQLCINFANERLQQIFNNFVFKVEQDLYIQEQILWNPIDFPDNNESVELLQQISPTLGIFPALDEECRIPRGSDISFLNKLVREYGPDQKPGHPKFDIVRKNPNYFTIIHYAGAVSYCVDGFLEKNKDQLSAFALDTILSSSDQWIVDLAAYNFCGKYLRNNQDSNEGILGSPSATKKKQTVGASFRRQLNTLVSTIKLTTPHFIRCVKPNNLNVPDQFDRKSVSEQLNYSGVLQAIQVSRAGYPVRFNHQEFLLDYIILCSPVKGSNIELDKTRFIYWRNLTFTGSDDERRIITKEFLTYLEENKVIKKNNEQFLWSIGLTRVFLKVDMFRILESLRMKIRDIAATRIQSIWRMNIAKKIFKVKKKLIVDIQRIYRGFLCRKEYKRLLKHNSAIFILNYYRSYQARQKFLKMKKSCIIIQGFWRNLLNKRIQEEIRINNSASIIQATFKMYKEYKYFKSLSIGVKKIQTLWRGRLARRQLRKLREERNQIGQIFAKYQESNAELQKLRGSLSRLEDQLSILTAERNKLRDEVLLLQKELNIWKDTAESKNQKYIEMQQSVEVLKSQVKNYGDIEQKYENANKSNSDEKWKDLYLRLLKLSSYPYTKMGLLESLVSCLFPTDTESIVSSHQDRQIGLLFCGSASSGNKLLMNKFLDFVGIGSMEDNQLQVYTLELANIPGGHILGLSENLRDNNIRESSIGERWPLNIMNITGLESEEMILQAISFFSRARVAVFVYDIANYQSFAKLFEVNDVTIGGPINKAIESGCLVILFGNLYSVVHNKSPIQVKVEEVRRIGSELDIVTLESDSIIPLIYSIVGILTARCYSQVQQDHSDKSLSKQLQNSFFSRFNDGIQRAFGIRSAKYAMNKLVSDKAEFLIPTVDSLELPDELTKDYLDGICPVVNIKDEQNSSVTHIVFCRDIQSEPYTLLLVARKNGIIQAYYCYKTRFEYENEENSAIEWSGRVEEAYSRKAHNRAITSLALSPDESEFLSTSIDMTVRRFLTANGQAISLFSDNSPVLVGSYLPFLPSLFIVSSSKPLLRIVNVDIGVAQKIKTDSTIRALCFDSTGMYCFAACKEGRIYVLVNIAVKSATNMRTSVETDFRFTDKRGMQVCSRAITNMSYINSSSNYSLIKKTKNLAPSLPVLVVNAADSTITVIDIRLQAPTGQIDISTVPHVVLQVRFRIANPHSLMPLRSCFSTHGGIWIASAAEDCTVRIFSLNSESFDKEQVILTGHNVPVISTAINASSTILASGDADGIIIIWRRFASQQNT
ncbi:myosin head family protein [Cryptosporidium muris RN66]|uniref:Myosin head family protein n=1 Tax=Cryptosporidium muris (strain RN66) TaxID=441375 RepID=B6AJE5_CRYMR|nr:myosin head family protein [Cryptosporidium muris RN66]EEA08336.1 myosin head family protein [Cryptosporidium muris RN66]|eukprot:XP_002142685.1 myosin head family protein [Cryptosporidium muris RN66]